MQKLFPKGDYYVGDPCYLFDKSWKEILDGTNYLEDGEHKLFGERVFVGSTAYGDGCYSDNFGRQYGVDAGLLGILPVSLIEVDNHITKKSVEKSNDMHIVHMDKDFFCEVVGGVFRFGDIVINTRDDEDEETEEGES